MGTAQKSQPAPRAVLSLGDAVFIGAGSMIGAGLFAAFAPATAAAGPWLFLSLALAAGIALCNAASSAQLAAQHPQITVSVALSSVTSKVHALKT